MDPTFVSVTYGAGGSLSQREKTIDIVAGIKADFGLEAMAHFTCVNATTEELRATLDRMRDAGHRERAGAARRPAAGRDGVDGDRGRPALLARADRADPRRVPEFAIGAACFPEVHIHAESPESDLRYLKEKVDAGARFLITQLFFDNAYYYDFVARAREVGDRRADHPGHHADHQLRADPPDHGDVRLGDPRAPRRRARRARRRRRAP